MAIKTTPLAPQFVEYLKNALKTAQIFKCDDIVLESDVFRGMNTDRSLVIADPAVPADLPFVGMGINDVAKLVARMGLVENYNVEMEMNDGFVLAINIKAKGTSIKYRCANPKAIKSYRQYKDIDNWQIDIPPEAIAQVIKAASAMGSETITINSSEDGCEFVLEDGNRNNYKQSFIGDVENVTGVDDAVDFSFNYSRDVFITALKHAESAVNPEELESSEDAKPKKKGPLNRVRATIGRLGSMKVVVNSITVSLSHITTL